MTEAASAEVRNEERIGFAKCQNPPHSKFCCLFLLKKSNTCTGLGIEYPELVVFDLDACLWDQEMYEMSALPDKTVYGPLNGA